MRTDLLTAEDIEFIEEHGVPNGLRHDLAIEGDDDTVVLTLKGMQFYEHACRRYGVSAEPAALSDLLELLELHQGICRARVDLAVLELKQAYDTGRIRPENRDWVRAQLHGTGQERLTASMRLQKAREAGPNVIPVNFRRN